MLINTAYTESTNVRLHSRPLRRLTCRKLTVIRMREYELIPPVNTSFRSRCRRNCFSTNTRNFRLGYSVINSYKNKTKTKYAL